MARYGPFFTEGERERTVRRRPAERAAPMTRASDSVVEAVAQLQRSAGNAAVNALLRHYAAQREAAEPPMAPPEEDQKEAPAALAAAAATPEAGEEATALQLKREGSAEVSSAPEVGLEGGPVSPALANRVSARLGSGAPLDPSTRTQMEGAFGTSFADVGIHTDQEADALNRSVSATAFTTGSDVFFSQGTYDPGSSAGRQLLAHELTHVVQQRSMSQSGPLTVGAAGDSHEQAADAAASAVVTGAVDEDNAASA